MFHDEDIYPTTVQERDLDAALRQAQFIRQADRKHQEARNRALREVRNRVLQAQAHIDASNFGLAQDALNSLLHDLDDEYGTPIIVRRRVEELFS